MIINLKNFIFPIKYLLNNRRGSDISRKSHSRPNWRRIRGASLFVSAKKSKAAPTDTVQNLWSVLKIFAMKNCFGAPIPIQTMSALDSWIIFFQSGKSLNQLPLKFGEYVPAIEILGLIIFAFSTIFSATFSTSWITRHIFLETFLWLGKRWLSSHTTLRWRTLEQHYQLNIQA